MFHPFKSPQAGLIVVVVEVTSCKTSRVRRCLVLVCYSETILSHQVRANSSAMSNPANQHRQGFMKYDKSTDVQYFLETRL